MEWSGLSKMAQRTRSPGARSSGITALRGVLQTPVGSLLPGCESWMPWGHLLAAGFGLESSGKLTDPGGGRADGRLAAIRQVPGPEQESLGPSASS